MKILLISRFNVPNLGDLIISNTLYSYLTQYGETDRYNLFGDPHKFVDINNIEPTSYSFKYKISNFLNKYNLKKVRVLFSLLRKLIITKNSYQKKEYKDIVDLYDLIVIGGGNMLMSITEDSSSINSFHNYVELALQKRKEVFVMDIGIGPFKNKVDLDLAMQALNKCSKITFRDESSYELYINNGGNSSIANISVDPVFLATFNKEKKSEIGDNIKVGINIIDSRLIGQNEKSYKEKIKGYARIIEMLNKESIEVFLFITSKEDQSALDDTYKLVKDITKVTKVKVNGCDDIVKIYNNIDLLIGTRMHSMIIAYTMGVPVLGLSWQNKVDSFFDIINESDSCFKFDSFENDTLLIIEKVKRKVENSASVSEFMKKNLKIIKAKSESSKNILEKYSNDLR